jgi:hypothetical protein
VDTAEAYMGIMTDMEIITDKGEVTAEDNIMIMIMTMNTQAETKEVLLALPDIVYVSNAVTRLNMREE